MECTGIGSDSHLIQSSKLEIQLSFKASPQLELCLNTS
jgi:hypothetical protein